ncbi:hypothetical protein K435DRAFT_759125 [Dendrothele bispora CBS 962.96]|uniref:Uncharacterized protein n=1 Tax=Dendrothele bispora (strain CBS 962.96) TaxID=1314807 RepID=A0A4V4HEL6_DENBC|nr:hypothetical protein K435DRAFT_759125 [Dendrothele bispora CBS 962.96]
MSSPKSKQRSKHSQKLASLKDEGDWEDVLDSSSENDTTAEIQSTPSTPTRKRTPVRVGGAVRRRILTKDRTSLSASPSKHHTRTQIPTRPWKEDILTDGWFDDLVRAIWSVLVYVVQICIGSFKLLLRPLSFLLFLFVFATIVGAVLDKFRIALKPFCFLPVISSTSMCRPDIPRSTPVGTQIPNPKKLGPKWADYPKLIDAQNSFEVLLDDSVGGSGLALDIKKAEMATSDLVVLVRFSQLTSKDLLADTLVKFVQDARKTGRGLQRLGSKVGGAVDQILAVNDYALHSIEAAKDRDRFPYVRSLVPFFPKVSTEEVVLKTFTEAMNVLSGNIERLIIEAEAQRVHLEKLEEHLTVIHELVSREDSHISAARAELLAYLWTHLGGNRKEMKGYDDHLRLLKGLADYRKRALIHVVSALQTLHALSDDMEDIRERVTGPQLTGGQIPLDVHMRSISIGLERLQQSRINAAKKEEEALNKVLGIEAE